jgi:hypothetical protein
MYLIMCHFHSPASTNVFIQLSLTVLCHCLLHLSVSVAVTVRTALISGCGTNIICLSHYLAPWLPVPVFATLTTCQGIEIQI